MSVTRIMLSMNSKSGKRVKPSSLEETRCCGSCCKFLYEDADGWGYCSHVASGDAMGVMHCSDLCTQDKFVSEVEKRHHLAMLRKCQRCLHLADYKDMDVAEIQKSIDFVVEYCKLI